MQARARRYQRRKAAGTCTRCGRSPARDDALVCTTCTRTKSRIWRRSYAAHLARAGKTGTLRCHRCMKRGHFAKTCEQKSLHEKGAEK